MIRALLDKITSVKLAVRDRLQGRPMPTGTTRSPEWPRVRREHLVVEPKCQWCGGTVSLDVHHLEPFHIDPALELAPANLITLCEATGLRCHLEIGHDDNWKNVVPGVRERCNAHQHGQ
jgi:5-methylcytosine-specific restriction endonuclease McrA